MVQLEGYDIREKFLVESGVEIYRGKNVKLNQAVFLKKANTTDEFSDSVIALKNEYEIYKYLDIGLKFLEFKRLPDGFVLLVEDTTGSVSLKELIEKNKLDLEIFFRLSISICENLYQLHLKKIIHKNLKPASVIVETKNWQAKLINFGIATRFIEERRTTSFIRTLEGSIHYISPEQTGRMNRAVDYRSDFYSLGITFYEMLTGRLPFENEDFLELIHSHLARIANPARMINPDIPQVLSEIISKLMSKNAEDRYQTVNGLKQDLEKCYKEYKESGEISDFVLGTKDVSDEFKIAQKLYGREKDIEALLDEFGKVIENGQTHVQLIGGYSGIGKSSLVKEIHKPITKAKGYFLYGEFEQFKRLPLYGIIQAFSKMIKYILAEPPDKVENWKVKIQNAIGVNGKVIVDVIPELEYIIGKQPDISELDSVENANRFYLTFQNFINVFCYKDHPIALFLDDIQWADNASLNFIKSLILDFRINYLYLMLSYRDNEIESTHPFYSIIDELKKEGIPVSSILLRPLSLNDIHLLCKDSLQFAESDDLAKCKSLAEAIYYKTGGNSFFINELLKQLVRDGSIFFNHSTNRWDWDYEKIVKSQVSDNIIELLIERIEALPDDAKDMLQLSACIGNKFDLVTLSYINQKSLKDTALEILEAVIEELVFPESEDYKILISSNSTKEEELNNPQMIKKAKGILFHFRHDKVQEACYEMIDPERRKAVRIKIGRLLLQNTSQEELEENLFNIVSHYNYASELVETEEEREKLVLLNLRVGRKAKFSAAYKTALEYFNYALLFLGKNRWKDKYELSFVVYRELAEMHYLNGNFDESEELIYESIDYIHLPIQKAELFKLLIVQYTLSGRFLNAIIALRKGLEPLGIDIPDENNLEQAIKDELKKTRINLGDRKISSLIDEKEINDPEKRIAIKILTTTTPASYFISPLLWSVIVLKTVNICLVHGNVGEAYGYACYGIILGSILGDYNSGYEFGKLAVKMSEKFNNISERVKAANVLANHIIPWVNHIKISNQMNKSESLVVLESGEFQHGSYIYLHMSVNYFQQGEHLSTIERNNQELLRFTYKVKNFLAIDTIIGVDLIVNNLLNKKVNLSEFKTESMREEEFLKGCKEHQSTMAICIYKILKAQVLYLYNDLKNAYKEIFSARRMLPYITGINSVAEYNFYYSLILSALSSETIEKEKNNYVKQIKQNQKQMKEWAKNCSENYLHKYLLVEAELARIQDKDWKTILEFYDSAIEEAHKNAFVQVEALCNELAGKFWISVGKPKLAESYIEKAYSCYETWGAVQKIEQLKKVYHNIFIKKENDSKNVSIYNKSLSRDVIDFQSILKISNAITGEIELENLLKKLIKILIENTGAQRAVLVLRKEDGLYVEAEGYISNTIDVQMKSILVGDYKTIPVSLIYYVERTKENIVLDELKLDFRFNQDEYLVKNNVKSILCCPIIYQTELKGIVYLENNITSNAFPDDRLQVSDILLSQAAIALENAILYSNLSSHIEERSRTNTIMEITQKIQTSLIPKEFQLKDYKVSAYMQTADEVGGDYYDIIETENKKFFVIGDVCGHGLSAGLVMMMVQTLIHGFIHAGVVSVSEILVKVNKTLIKNIYKLKDDKYMTLTLFSLEEDGRIIYSGSHQDLLVYRKELKKVEAIKTYGSWLGIIDDISDVVTEREFRMEAGDTLLLFTDGIIEAVDSNGSMYSKGQLIKLLENEGENDPETIKQKLINSLENYVVDDDITFMLLKKL
ncbi:MAG: AAA family ATPase [Leptospiraceae bacterium]|nr:AAA family ATPase [Leptospiraceae bacterium]